MLGFGLLGKSNIRNEQLNEGSCRLLIKNWNLMATLYQYNITKTQKVVFFRE